MASASQPTILSSLTEMRARTDVAISQGWLLWAVASYVLWTVLAVITLTGAFRSALSPDILLGVLGSLGLIASTGLSYLVFRLIDRQNKHSGREQALFSEAMTWTRSRVAKDDVKTLLPLSSAEQDFSNVMARTRERSAFLWALLTLVPYFGWVCLIIALALLTQESNVHRRTEQPLLEDLDRTLRALGSPGLPLGEQRRSFRTTAVYAIASVFTLGVFTLIWMHLMIRDYETHFSYHTAFEESILRAVLNPDSQPGRTI